MHDAQEAAEAHLVTTFEQVQRAAIHAKRVYNVTQLMNHPVAHFVQITIHPEDFKLILDLRRFGSKDL